MEPVSELVDQTDDRHISLLALLQILYEIEQCEKERKAALNAKNLPTSKGSKDNNKKKRQKQTSKSPPKDGVRRKSPENAKNKLKKTKAVKDLINAAKETHILPTKNVQIRIDQPINEDDEESSLEELLEDLCFLLLTDSQIVCISILLFFQRMIHFYLCNNSKKKLNQMF